MEKISSETNNPLVAKQEAGKKSNLAFDFLLMMSTAAIIGALAVGMFIMVLP